MDQSEFERWMVVLIIAGTSISVLEFLVVGLLIGRGTIVGLQNGLLAGGAVVIVVVILVWLATSVMKPMPSSKPAEEAAGR